MPPKEWFYYMVERIKKRLKETGFKPRPGSPYRTISQVAPAIAGQQWWGTRDGMKPETKQRILREVIRNRARGKAVVVTGREGSITKAQARKEIGSKAADRLYKRLKLTSNEIKEAKQLLKVGVPALERALARPRVAANPELLIITGNPGVDLMDKKHPPTLEEMRQAYPEMYKAAIAQHKKFHGVEPESMKLQWVDSDVPPFMVIMGEAPDITYHVKGKSRKQKKIPFKHDYKGKVYVCSDVKGKIIAHIPDNVKGKNVRVTDWVRG